MAVCTQPTATPVAVLLPVKAFHLAKQRLSDTLSPAERMDLARRMADRVVRSASGLPTAVVCDDDAVSIWATSLGIRVLWRPSVGLNQAVEDGVATLGDEGVRRVIVAHGDLPLADDLGWLATFPGVTVVPDRRGGGTNVLCVPTGRGFRFGYGYGSCDRHRAEAARIGASFRLVRDELLGWDVDTAEDLELPSHLVHRFSFGPGTTGGDEL